MTTAKGMQGWIEIFRGGRQVDAGNKEHDGDALVDRAVATFNAAEHEPPMVIGHPKTDSPACGWIKEVKSEVVNGVKSLLALPHQVQPEFEEGVRSGRYKKRSAAFYPDGRLRHVGFLGAMPPAVKGLSNIAFNEDEEFFVIEFNEQEEDHSMDEVAKLKQQLADKDEALKKAETERDAAKNDATQASAQFAESQKEQQREKIETFIDKGVEDGKLLPAWKPGLAEFMEHLSTEDATTIEFAEGDSTKKVEPLKFFQDFLLSFSEHPLFKDMARPDAEDKKVDAEFAEAEVIGKDMAAMVNG